MIELIRLHKTYTTKTSAVTALQNINLHIKQGEIFGVIGTSGAGKSTLIRCVNLLERPDTGKVIIDQQDLMQLDKNELLQARRNIGMIFQHFNLLSSRNVYDNVALPLELIGKTKTEIADIINPLLELTGLSDKRQHYSSQLSGGQKQRVAIARALACSPKILLSDEATSALDPETTHAILQLLKDINQKLGVTILLITHEMNVVKEICHRLAILENGKIIEENNVLEFFGTPKTDIAKKFTRSASMQTLPESIQNRLSAQQLPGTIPLWRISFIGKVAEEPLVADLSRHFTVNLNILQAHIEQVRDETIGIMLVEAMGDSENIQAAAQYLITKGVNVEVIGYVEQLN